MEKLYFVWLMLVNSFILFLFYTDSFKTKTKWILGGISTALYILGEYLYKGENLLTSINTYYSLGIITSIIILYFLYKFYSESKPLEVKEQLKQLDMIILFGIIRKSGIELSINISHAGVVYSFSNEKPFNQENWDKSLLGFIDEKIITKDESDIYNKFINSIRGIESLGVLIEKLKNDPKRDDKMTEKMITLLSSVQEKK